MHRRPTDYDDSIPKPDPTPYHNEKDIREPVKQTSSRDENSENLRKSLEKNFNKILKMLEVKSIGRKKSNLLLLRRKRRILLMTNIYLNVLNN